MLCCRGEVTLATLQRDGPGVCQGFSYIKQRLIPGINCHIIPVLRIMLVTKHLKEQIRPCVTGWKAGNGLSSWPGWWCEAALSPGL